MATPEVMGANQSNGSFSDDTTPKTLLAKTASGMDDGGAAPDGLHVINGNSSFELAENSLLNDDTDYDSMDEGATRFKASNGSTADKGLKGLDSLSIISF